MVDRLLVLVLASKVERHACVQRASASDFLICWLLLGGGDYYFDTYADGEQPSVREMYERPKEFPKKTDLSAWE